MVACPVEPHFAQRMSRAAPKAFGGAPTRESAAASAMLMLVLEELAPGADTGVGLVVDRDVVAGAAALRAAELDLAAGGNIVARVFGNRHPPGGPPIVDAARGAIRQSRDR